MRITDYIPNSRYVRGKYGWFLAGTRFVPKCFLSILIVLALPNCSRTYAQGSVGDGQLLIDDFVESIPRLDVQDITGTFPVTKGATVTGSVLGGELDVLLVLDGVENPSSGASLEVSDGKAIFGQDASSKSGALLIWDGVDGDPVRTVASTGLNGGTDLTGGGAFDGIEVKVARNDLPLKAGVIVFSSVNDASELVQDVPVTDTQTSLWFSFPQFTASRGSGADLAKATTVILDVGALQSATGPAHIEICSISATSSQPPPGEGGVLYDQIEQLPSSANWSVDFPGDNPWDAEAADDFIIPSGQTWIVDMIAWAAEWRPAPPANPTANVTIYADRGGVPGDPLLSESQLPIIPAGGNSPIWSAPLPQSWKLGEGTYWCSVQANVPVGFEMLIKESSVARGNWYVWRNPGGGFGTSCSDWTPATTCLGQQPSLAFRLQGAGESISGGQDLQITNMTYAPSWPRAQEPVAVELTVKNRGFQGHQAHLYWFSNLATHPQSGRWGDYSSTVALGTGESSRVELDTYVYREPGCYDTYARVGADQEPGGSDSVQGPTRLCVATAEPLAFWFGVQATDEGFATADGQHVMCYNGAAQPVCDITTTAQPLVQTLGDRLIVVDGNEVKLYDPNGSQIGGAITTDGSPQIATAGQRIVVTEKNQVRLYDKDGKQIGSPILTTNQPAIHTTDDRIIVADGNEIKLYDLNGNQIGGVITTASTPQVATAADRIIVIENNQIRLYDKDGKQIGGPILTTNPPTISTTSDRLIVVDGNEVKLYDLNGNQIGGAITTASAPRITTTTDRIIVTENAQIRLYDKDGKQIGGPILTSNQPIVRTTDDRIIVVDGNEIKLYDQSGNQIGGAITTASAPRVAAAADRIIVIENNQIRLYDKDGKQIGGPILTTNQPIIRMTGERILVIDGGQMSIYDTDGNRLNGPTTLSPRQAELMRSQMRFEPGDREKVVWVPISGPATVLMQSDGALSAEAYDLDRNLLDGTGSQQGMTLRLKADTPSDYFVVMLSRPDGLTNTSQNVEMAVKFDDPAATFLEDSPNREFMIYSPLRTFPGGTDIFDLPEDSPYSSFDAFVENEYGYSLQQGILGLNWLVNEELSYVQYPPAGIPGPLPPAGVRHNDNYCGISTFIHCMQTNFPGALKANVTTKAKSWDEVGDNLDHSNTFGIRGAKMVENINKNYGGNNPATQNGQKYCAKKIWDTSPANLAAWAEDCNLKVLVYDFSHLFGHWADVVSVTPVSPQSRDATLNLQDYGLNYNVSYSKTLFGGDQIDFSGAPLNSVMRGNFDQNNPVAGDGRAEITLPIIHETISVPTEIVGFSVICQCDPSTNECPTTTKSGKTLNP